MLMNLTAGVNFINILQAAFTSADPPKAKNTVKLSVFFALLGSSPVKDVSKMLTNQLQVSISSTFYSRIFRTNVFFAAFL